MEQKHRPRTSLEDLNIPGFVRAMTLFMGVVVAIVIVTHLIREIDKY